MLEFFKTSSARGWVNSRKLESVISARSVLLVAVSASQVLEGALVPLVAGACPKVTAVFGSLSISFGSFSMFARWSLDGGRLGNLGLPAVAKPFFVSVSLRISVEKTGYGC